MKPVEMLVMRLADMTRVHPQQITATCSLCGHEVGVYPSGQRMMRQMPELRLVCSVCSDSRGRAVINVLAPGAAIEPFETEAFQPKDKSKLS